MAQIKIETSQNVILNFELAGLAERIIASVIDFAIVYLYAYLIINIFLYDIINSYDAIGVFLYMIFLIIIPFLCYDIVLEILTRGQSIGKRILKIRVIKLDGSKPSNSDFATRWVLRSIDNWGVYYLIVIIISAFESLSYFSTNILYILFFIPLPLVGIIFIGATKKGQRIGDMAAGTVVVKKTRPVSLEDTVLIKVADNYKPKYLNVLKLSDNDIRAIKEAITIAEKHNSLNYCEEVAGKVKEFLEVTEKVPAIKFLKIILKDYNYLANQNNSNENIHR